MGCPYDFEECVVVHHAKKPKHLTTQLQGSAELSGTPKQSKTHYKVHNEDGEPWIYAVS